MKQGASADAGVNRKRNSDDTSSSVRRGGPSSKMFKMHGGGGGSSQQTQFLDTSLVKSMLDVSGRNAELEVQVARMKHEKEMVSAEQEIKRLTKSVDELKGSLSASEDLVATLGTRLSAKEAELDAEKRLRVQAESRLVAEQPPSDKESELKEAVSVKEQQMTVLEAKLVARDELVAKLEVDKDGLAAKLKLRDDFVKQVGKELKSKDDTIKTLEDIMESKDADMEKEISEERNLRYSAEKKIKDLENRNMILGLQASVGERNRVAAVCRFESLVQDVDELYGVFKDIDFGEVARELEKGSELNKTLEDTAGKLLQTTTELEAERKAFEEKYVRTPWSPAAYRNASGVCILPCVMCHLPLPVNKLSDHIAKEHQQSICPKKCGFCSNQLLKIEMINRGSGH